MLLDLWARGSWYKVSAAGEERPFKWRVVYLERRVA